MLQHGFLRVAAATPRLRVADCQFNAERIVESMQHAESMGVRVLVFPELCLTGYTCGDLFHSTTLQQAALKALQIVVRASTSSFSGVALVGLPLFQDVSLFNCAAVLHRGKVLGVVPKSYLPNYKEYYEDRWFAPAAASTSKTPTVDNTPVPFGTNLLFAASDASGLVLGVELCEDVWTPTPPSCNQAMHGATVLLNLSASNDLIGKAQYRRQLIANQSGRCLAAYVYASSGPDESTTDVVFGGHCLIAENGVIVAESKRFQREHQLTVSDVDIDRLNAERQRTGSFSDAIAYSGTKKEFVTIPFLLGAKSGRLGFPRPGDASPPAKLLRTVEAHPFVPAGADSLRERCEEIFQIQVSGLAKRLEHAGKPRLAIGVSGGLDSTLALLVACRTLDALGWPRQQLQAFTMPGFGTTERTRNNAMTLMKLLGVTSRVTDIRALCLEEMKLLGHSPFGIDITGLDVDRFTEKLRSLPPDRRQDLVFENVQARMRTHLLMDSGFVIGTGDLSELALGWCTYNGDQMSMYNPNVSIPKTLVQFLVRWAAEHEFADETRQVLLDIVATVISPELLPTAANDKGIQDTQAVIGPYELHDFFLFHFLRYGATPEKLLYLAEQARFHREYSAAEVRKWLRVFLTRFFASQFKRSCLPDGPKVGSISLSPRGDWRMPSDAQATAWLAAVPE
jgi:NAD+ synthase (glutamine-hydrolysing)